MARDTNLKSTIRLRFNQKQLGFCAICNRTEKEVGKVFALDHDHETGQFRGLLCTACNLGLGCFKDSKSMLLKAIDYLAQDSNATKNIRDYYSCIDEYDDSN